MKRILIGLLMFVVITVAAHALLDENKYYYEDIDMRIITNDNIDSIYGIEFFDRENIVLQLQCNSVILTDLCFKRIDKFLKNGGTVWVYDSTVAEKFGFVKSDFSSKAVQGRKVTTDYAHISDYPAYLCKAYPASDSPVLKGVKSVLMNCIAVGNDAYSAIVKACGDTNFYPILKLNDSGSFVCAYRTWGKGKVVFISGINEKEAKNPLFVANLKEFSFNLSIPEDSDKKDKKDEAPKYKCTIGFIDSTSKAGYIMNKNIEFFANNENKIYEFNNVSKVKFLQPNAEDEIYFKDGKILKGLVIMSDIEFSSDGQYVEKYGKKEVVEILFQ